MKTAFKFLSKLKRKYGIAGKIVRKPAKAINRLGNAAYLTAAEWFGNAFVNRVTPTDQHTEWLKQRDIPLKITRNPSELGSVVFDLDVGANPVELVRLLSASKQGQEDLAAAAWHEIGHVIDATIQFGTKRIIRATPDENLGRRSQRKTLIKLLNEARSLVSRADELIVMHKGRKYHRADIEALPEEPKAAQATKRRLERRMRQKAKAWSEYCESPFEMFAEAVSARMRKTSQLFDASPALFHVMTEILTAEGIICPALMDTSVPSLLKKAA